MVSKNFQLLLGSPVLLCLSSIINLALHCSAVLSLPFLQLFSQFIINMSSPALFLKQPEMKSLPDPIPYPTHTHFLLGELCILRGTDRFRTVLCVFTLGTRMVLERFIFRFICGSH